MKRKITALITAAAMTFCGLNLSVFAENAEYDEPQTLTADTGDTAALTGDIPQQDTYMYSLPKNMRASVITPGADYFTSGSESADELTAQLDKVFSEFADIGLNTVIINTMNGADAFYSLDNVSDESDPVLAAIRSANTYGISPYVVFDLSHALSDCRSGADIIDTLISRTHRFARKYACAGIILDDYYARRSAQSYGEYMENGSGIGYTNWLYDTAEQYFRTAADVIRRTDNTIAAGFIINDMWANSSSIESGSDTNDSFQAFIDGYSDTKSFIENGYIDFAVLRTYGSITSQRLPFEKVTGWWGSLADQYSIPLYIMHSNEYIGTDTVGWNSEDQLLKQLTVAKKIESYGGSVFSSFSSLMSDPLGTTSTLTSYYNEQINEESLFSDLKMTSPSSLTFTTTEASVAFMGSFDSNFPVYFNNEPIKLNDAGNFYFEKKLSDGLNTFTIQHKSKTYTYNITRKITVLKEIGAAIADGKSLSVDGGTKIKLIAKAYKGSTVYGTIYGTTVPMSESTAAADEEDTNSSYVKYVGTYTVPNGIIGQTQQLGKIHIYGSYAGYSMETVGASVTVNAEPEPVKQVEAVIVSDGSTAGSGEVIATLDTTHESSEKVKFVKTLANGTMVYDGKTADDIPSPLFSQLPTNTLEYYKSTLGNYYVTESGKRISTSASTLVDGTAINSNALFVKSIGTTGGDSYIKMHLDNRTGFNMRLAGNNYYSSYEGDYYLNSFTATHLYITFENITSVTSLPSFEYNQVFRSGKWDTVTEANGTKFRLILELRQPGVYSGQWAQYDGNGDLILYFPVPVNSLSGYTIVIDPGHGYGKRADLFDPGAIGEIVEQEANLAVAKELESQLAAAGANVIRLKTESTLYITKERPIVARSYGCDMFISLHSNKGIGTARGVEAYYFNSFSQPLAAAISSNIAKYYQNNVYSDGANKDRGALYSYYHVTLQQDFPSVLVEMGFVDNIQDAMALASPTHQKGIAAGIVSGIKSYLSRSSISYASEGYSAADSSSAEVTTIAVTTTTPPETEEPVSEDTEAETTTVPEETTADTQETEDISADTGIPEETTVPEDAAEITTMDDSMDDIDDILEPEQ